MDRKENKVRSGIVFILFLHQIAILILFGAVWKLIQKKHAEDIAAQMESELDEKILEARKKLFGTGGKTERRYKNYGQ